MRKLDVLCSKISFEDYYLEKLTYDGARLVYGEELDEDVDDRLKFELEIIKEKGLSNFFLIINELINSMRKNDAVIFPINCKISGSLVAYCLGITYLDPLMYDLMFENFIQIDDELCPMICIGIDVDSGREMKSMMRTEFGVDHIPGFEIREWDYLSKIAKVFKNIDEIHGRKYDFRRIPLNDSYCLEVFRRGMTDYLGLFSVEERRRSLQVFDVKSIRDIAAFHAFYNHRYDYQEKETFFNSKLGFMEFQCDLSVMRRYLGETYGFLLYQEQLIMLSRVLADFSREESHQVVRRRADSLKELFINNGQRNHYDPFVLEKIWANWKRIGYSLLSKSEAFDYAFMAYQIAYLRTHYPIEFQLEFPWNSEHRLRLY